MGLNVSHDAFQGAYSAFMRWRIKLAEVAGYGDLMEYEGFQLPFGEENTNVKKWPESNKYLEILLTHSDCDGCIDWKDCSGLADELEKLLPFLKNAGDGGGHLGLYFEATMKFIKSLRLAVKNEENLEFS